MAAIRCISKIRNFLSNQAALALVHSFVTSRIDSCNSLLFDLPSIEIHRVQMLQNIAARLVTRTPRSQSISHPLKKLHWLPIEKRIIFKLLLLTYQAQHGLAPHTWQIYSHHTNQPVISVPATRHYYVFSKLVHHTMAADHLQLQGPTLWNNLPQSLRQTHSLIKFKSSLKTHLFVSDS